LRKEKWGRPSSGTTQYNIVNKTSSAGFPTPAMPILEFSEIGRIHRPPHYLLVLGCSAQYRRPKGETNMAAKNMPTTQNENKTRPQVSPNSLYQKHLRLYIPFQLQKQADVAF